MSDALSREHALERDAADPLAGFRERFVNADPERIYLDGNSLGRLPLATRDRTGSTLRRGSATRWLPACSVRAPAR